MTTATAGTQELPESKYLNTTTVEKLLDDSRLHLGNMDLTEPIRVFKHHWIETMRDLRLLHKEGELMSLSKEIRESVLQWISEQCEKRFADDESPDMLLFAWSMDFDKNGIVYYLGSDGGASPWRNPATPQVGKIRVTASSVMHDSTPESAVCGREAVRCVTKPVKDSWYQIDFRPRKIRPNYYTLRHYSTWDTEALRSWIFEAHNGDGKWDVIKRHQNDDGLSVKGGPHSWQIEDCNDFYSVFRVRQTDYNSNRHYYLALSGFEIYGALKEEEKENESTLTFIPSYPFDTNGIIYWLGTNRGLEQWQNPGIRGLSVVRYSSLHKDSAPGNAVLGRQTLRCVTEPKKLSWMCIDLKNVKVIPTHYSIRHYASYDTEALRNWRLEACNDTTDGLNGHWVILMTHRNDTSLNAKGATHTWKIPANVVNNQSFSKYRLFQYGPNSNQHHYLACSGFELYGTVIDGIENGPIEIGPPVGPTRDFLYQFDMDYNGLFYFLGTGGFQRQWTNPMDNGFITITSSSLMSDSRPLSAVVARNAVRCVTKPHQKSWIQIDLKDIKMLLNKYTIRHYSSWDTEALRYWNFEGSNDGKAWTAIRNHMDDRSLRKAGGTHTWDVNCNQYYRYFRLFMTDRNSNNHWYLACSGLEFYGKATGGLVSQRINAVASPVPQQMGGNMQQPIIPQAFNMNQQPQIQQQIPINNPIQNQQAHMSMVAPLQSKRSNKNSLSFDYEQDNDGNGLVYWLSTKGNTTRWTNPMDLKLITVSSSGLINDGNGAPLQAVVGQNAVRCVTKPHRNAWFAIDFHDYAIQPTHYTLRHYASWDTEALRFWRFEGSCDGETWTVIREHNNDDSLKFKGQMATWRLRCQHYYSKFRIFQYDKNSNSHYYLALSGFEIYGNVLRQNRHMSWDQWPKNKSKHLHVEPNTNCVSNMDSGDTWQTIKVHEAFDFTRNQIQEFTILLEKATNTSNSWKYMIGIAPAEFTCSGSRQWLGSQKSWGYIAGTGGKCFDKGQSLDYGSKYGANSGEVYTCIANTNTHTIEFIFNGQSQGIAFKNFDARNGNFHPAVSITATGSRMRLMERVSPKTPFMDNMQQLNRQFGGMSVSNASAQIGQVQMGGARPVAASMIQPSSPRAIPRMPMAMLQEKARGQQTQILQNSNVKYGWDPVLHSPNLFILPDGATVTNKGSEDRWEGIVSQAIFSAGKHSFEIHVISDMKTSNTWKFSIGIAPVAFDPRKTGWLGSQGSWGYIGGTGGKCHDVGKSVAYGKRFGNQDVVKCEVDYNKKSIEFFKNGKSQGVAYKNLNGAVKPAVSITGKGTCLRIANVQ